MRAFWLLPAITLALASLSESRAGWGTGGCSMAAAPVAVATPVYAWQADPKDPEDVDLLYLGNRCVGGFRHSANVFRSYNGDWSAPCGAPVQLPARKIAAQNPQKRLVGDLPEWMVKGVDSSKLSERERVTINGREITQAEAIDLIERRRPRPGPSPDPDPEPSPTPGPNPGPRPNPNLPDDAGKLRLTVIGSPTDTAKVQGDFANRTDIVLRTYAPDHWHVSRVGFKTDGKPTIYLQQPDGKVLLRQDTYEGQTALAEAIRKADPHYDPTKDPDGKPKPPPTPKTPDPLAPPAPGPASQDIPPAAIVLGALGLAIAFKKVSSS